jgi:hypothetical protein
MTNRLIDARQEYLDGLERRIEDWTARVEALEARAADADPVSKADFEEGIDELWKRLDAARDEHLRLAEADEDAWSTCRSSCDQAWSEVEDAYGDLHRMLLRS